MWLVCIHLGAETVEAALLPGEACTNSLGGMRPEFLVLPTDAFERELVCSPLLGRRCGLRRHEPQARKVAMRRYRPTWPSGLRLPQTQ